MIDSHLVWEALLVDARAFSVAAAGDPFALPLPAQEQGERNKRGVDAENFSLSLLATEPRTKEETNIHQEQINGRTLCRTRS